MFLASASRTQDRHRKPVMNAQVPVTLTSKSDLEELHVCCLVCLIDSLGPGIHGEDDQRRWCA